MKKTSFLYLLLMVVSVLSVSCEHKDLCFDHPPHAHRAEYELRLAFDCEWYYNLENHIEWEQCWNEEFGVAYEDICPREPDGVRVHVYNEDDCTETVRNLTKQNATIRFSDEAHYDLLFYNNDTEYILFQELDSFNTAYATTRGSQGRNGVMNAPDMLFGAYLDSLFVEKKAIPDTLTVVLRPLVFTYLLRFEVSEGAELIESANGVLSGMAAGVSLGTGHTSELSGSLAFQCTMQGDYGTQGLVRSFGIPDYPNPHYASRGEDDECKQELYLQVQLTTGKTETFKFDITGQMLKQPRGGVILIEDIELGKGSQVSGGGFDVGVDDWGEKFEVELNGK